MKALPQRQVPSKIRSLQKSRLDLAKPPSPFLDYASTVIPNNLHDVWRWCAYFAISNPLINAAIVRKSIYPVTGFNLRGYLNDSEIDRWETLLKDGLNVQSFRVQANLDTYVYGHFAFSVLQPFDKYLICKKCGRHYLAKITKFRIDPWTKTFKVKCPECKGHQKAKVVDIYIKDPERIILRRWDPYELSVTKYGMGDERTYEIDFSTEFKNKIKLGKRKDISATPQEFVEAILYNKKMELFGSQVFIIEETALTPSNFSKSIQTKEGWSWPTLANVLPDAFHLKIVLKGEEALIMTQLIPFRMVTPAASGSTAHDPALAGMSEKWTKKMQEMIESWEQDPASVALSPVPSQLLQFGDPTRLMIPDQEMRLLMERILIGTRTPPEFVWGGRSWSGAAHSLRALENEFAALMGQHKKLIWFVMKKVAAILGWRMPQELYLQPIMSGDEPQKLSILGQMAQNGGLDFQTLHERLGLDSDAVNERIKKEQERRIRDQASLQRLQQELGLGPPPGGPQADPGGPQPPGQGGPPGQEGPPQEGGPQEGGPPQDFSGSYGVMSDNEILDMVPNSGVDPSAVHKLSQQLKNESPMRRAMILQSVSQKNPEMHEALSRLSNPLYDSINRPMPEQLPPRRDGMM